MPELTRSFAFGGVEMRVTESGQNDGPAFVLVHGIGMGHTVFDGVARVIGATGRVYAVDLPRFGDAPEPSDAQSMAGSGDLIAAFLRAEGIRGAVLVGHSMGTQVVVEAVARHPDLTDRLILIAPTVNRHERSGPRQAWRMLQDLGGENPKVLALGVVHYVKAGPRWFFRKLGVMLRHEVEKTYPRVAARTLVLRGETDRVCPRDWVTEVANLLPDAITHEIPGRGHEAMISNPHPVAEMILDHARR